MVFRVYIVVIFVFWFGVNGYSQVKGGVSVHSDPRLSMLLKSNRPTEPVEENRPVTNKKSGGRKQDKKPEPEKGVSYAKEIPKPKEHDPRNPNADVRDKIPVKIKEEKTVASKPGKIKPVSEDEQEAHKAVSGMSGGGKYSGKGFRVQIYNGPSREEALRRKAEFMRNYPGVHTYLIYASPCYKLKVGDYRRREDAIGMYHEANGTYSPCMIVPDEVAIHVSE